MIESVGLVLLAMASFLCAAFFAGVETGYYRFSQIKLSQRVKSRQLIAQWWQFMVKHREWFIAMVLVGTNLCQDLFSSVLYEGIQAVVRGTRAPGWVDPVWLSILIGTPLILVGAEIAPKRLFNRRADTLMYKLFVAVPAFLAMFLLAPLVAVLIAISLVLAMLLRLSKGQRESSLSHGSLRYLIQAEASQVSAPMRAFALQLLDSHQRKIESVMGPWDPAQVVAENTPLRGCVAAFRAANAFRLLVHGKDDAQRVVGSISLFDVAAEDRLEKPVGAIMRRACLIPCATRVKDAVRLLQTQKQSLAAVVDDAGRAIGIVSPESLSGELVASIKETGAGFTSSVGPKPAAAAAKS
ncbi:MAG TPA: CNNM domain-containing protein [Planctomycetota bacterium]|nr:CNNM domain-containing protein [Planctomycetota bacterium]